MHEDLDLQALILLRIGYDPLYAGAQTALPGEQSGDDQIFAARQISQHMAMPVNGYGIPVMRIVLLRGERQGYAGPKQRPECRRLMVAETGQAAVLDDELSAEHRRIE